MAERTDVLAAIDFEIKDISMVSASDHAAERKLRRRERTLRIARIIVSDAFDFIRDADCNCRPETEHYAAHTCSRCELLARVGGAP